MNKKDVTNFINSAKTALSKRSPEILTGLGIAGMITTTVLAVKATPKAISLLEEAKLDSHYKEYRNRVKELLGEEGEKRFEQKLLKMITKNLML